MSSRTREDRGGREVVFHRKPSLSCTRDTHSAQNCVTSNPTRAPPPPTVAERQGPVVSVNAATLVVPPPSIEWGRSMEHQTFFYIYLCTIYIFNQDQRAPFNYLKQFLKCLGNNKKTVTKPYLNMGSITYYCR